MQGFDAHEQPAQGQGPPAVGQPPREIYAVGGGTKSKLIKRMQSEVFGLPVTNVNREEGPAYGAALLAAVGIGAFPDLATATARTLTRAPLQHPDASAIQAYKEPYARFAASYRAARPANS